MVALIDTLSKERFLGWKEKATVWGSLEWILLVLMGAYIFINPFPHMTAVKGICLYLSLFLVCAFIIFKKIDFSFRTPLLIPFCLFTGWVLYGLFFAVDKENSIHDFHAHLLRYIAVYFILINVFNSRKRFMALSRTIIASAVTYSIVGISYYYLILGNSWTERYSYVEAVSGFAKGWLGYEVSGNSLCVLMIFSMLLTLGFLRKGAFRHNLALVLCLIPQLAFVFLVQSRGAYVALILSLIVLLWNNKKVQVAVLILFVVLVAMLPVKDRISVDSFKHDYRVKMLLTTLEVVKDYPVIGIGFGNETYANTIDLEMYNNRVPEEYRQMKGYITRAPHNMLLNILVRTGFLGLALFLSLLFVFFWMCCRCALRGRDEFIRKWGLCMCSVFLSFFVIGMFEQMFHHFTEVLLYTILAMGTILWRLNNNMKDVVPSGNSDR